VAKKIKSIKNRNYPHQELNPRPSGLKCSDSTDCTTVYPWYPCLVKGKGKGKFTQEQIAKAQRRSRCIVLSARWGWMVSATPWLLYPWERPSTHCIGGWVSPRAVLDGCRKSLPPPGFNPQTIQPVASHYTEPLFSTVVFLMSLEMKSAYVCLLVFVNL
jgi:hypothetical protein